MATNPPTLPTQQTKRPLGRWSRMGVPFSWEVGGTLVDLAADDYTVRVWVTDAGTTSGPYNATVKTTVATYPLQGEDLDLGSAGVTLVAVAENGTDVLVSDARVIPVADWPGAETYTAP